MFWCNQLEPIVLHYFCSEILSVLNQVRNFLVSCSKRFRETKVCPGKGRGKHVFNKTFINSNALKLYDVLFTEWLPN